MLVTGHQRQGYVGCLMSTRGRDLVAGTPIHPGSWDTATAFPIGAGSEAAIMNTRSKSYDRLDSFHRLALYGAA
jgi:hypothetical protein